MTKRHGSKTAAWKLFIQVIRFNTMKAGNKTSVTKVSRKAAAGLLFAGLLTPSLSGAEPGDYGLARDEAGYAASTLDSRVARLEKRMSGQPLAEMSREIDRLQEEVRLLRGTIEELRNGLDKARRQEKDHYAALGQRDTDLESRLQLLTMPPPAAPAIPPTAAPAPGADPNASVPQPGAAPAGVAPTAPVPPPPGVAAPGSGGALTTTAASSVPAASAPVAAPASPAPPIAPLDPMIRQRDYERAFETLKAGKYTDAIAEFQTFVAKYPEGDFSDNAHYWLGEAHYVNRDYAAAREAFRKMTADFPQSGKVPDAQLKLAFIEYENAQYAKAKSLLTTLIKRYPDTSAAKMAEKRLERMKQEDH